jgi:hypothetical protein
MNAAAALVEWIRGSTPRYIALMFGAWMMVVSLAYGTDLQNRHDETARDQCVSRVASRADVRGAFIGVYDLLDADRQNSKVNALREQLDATYPMLDVGDC